MCSDGVFRCVLTCSDGVFRCVLMVFRCVLMVLTLTTLNKKCGHDPGATEYNFAKWASPTEFFH